jgi:hypothetical protein
LGGIPSLVKTAEPAAALHSQRQRAKTIRYYLAHFLIYLGFLIIALLIAWLILKVNRMHGAYRLATQHLAALEANAQAGPSELDLVQVEGSLRGMTTSLEMLHNELSPFWPLTPYLGWVPVFGGDLEALPYLVAAGRDLGQAGVSLIEIVSPAIGHGSEATEIEPLPYLVASLTWARADLEQADILLRQHRADLNQFDFEQLSPRMAYRIDQLDRYLSQATSGLQLAISTPVLLGAETPQTYLILMQNSDELRPSGGYISAAGHVVFDKGQIVDFVMQDSYAVDRLTEDYPYPPDPLYQYMAADYWVLRDASWSPDFPTTASTAIWLYELGQGVSADGVIAVDQQALPDLLRAFEPLEVNGEQVTGDNVIELLRRHWEPEVGRENGSAWWSQRKSFMVDLAQAMRQQLEQGLSKVQLLTLATSLEQALAEKHVLVYTEEPGAADFLTELNWKGALQTVQSDYLMVVDAHVGFNKASALVDRQVTYQIALAEDGSARAHATLVYENRAQKRRKTCLNKLRYDPVYEQNMARCYWNYLRVVVPAGADLVSGPQIVVGGEYLLRRRPTTGEVDVTPLDSDKVSWGQLFLLAPEDSLSLNYDYTLPAGTARRFGDQWTYSLYLQKQPGTMDPAVEVVVTLPDGAQLIESQPWPLDQQGRVSTYMVSLSTDQKIEIQYRLP